MDGKNGTERLDDMDIDEIEARCTCDECGSEVDETTRTEIDATGYRRSTSFMELCNDCVSGTYICSDCDRIFIDGHNMRLFFGCGVCERCAENYDRCDSCGCDLRCDDVYSDEDGSYCAGCAPSDDDEDKDHRIHDYGYKPAPVFFGKGKMFFGCELEINIKDDMESAVDWVLENLGEKHVYLKEDGSLSNGFEIVSHPHSYEESKKLWANMSGSAPMTSHKSGECGFHVHVSRESLTRLQIQKMVVFVNAPENGALIDKIAQRTGNGYCAKKQAVIGRCGQSSSRYEAINLCNSKTVEFRIFRGNTRPERLLKNLEFVHALINWVDTVSYRQLTGARFAEYVAANKKEYSNLNKFITSETEENS